MDDGSTDDTAERACDASESVQVITQVNAGVAAARNRGVAELGTEWVAFLDSDDLWLPDHIERVGAAIRSTHGAAELYFDDSDDDELPDGVTLWQHAGFDPDSDVALVGDATPWVLLPLQPVAIMSSVVRRRRYLELGGMWPALRTREDTHFIFRIGLGGPACAVRGVGSRRTADAQPDGRLTASNGPGSSEYDSCTVRLYRDLIEQRPNLPPATATVLRERLVDGLISQSSNALRRADPRGLSSLGRALRLEPSTTIRRTLAGMWPSTR